MSLKVTDGVSLAGRGGDASAVVRGGRLGRSLVVVFRGEPLVLALSSLVDASDTRTPPASRFEDEEVRGGAAGKVKWLSVVDDRSVVVVRVRDCTDGRRPRALGGRGVVVPPTRGVLLMPCK